MSLGLLKARGANVTAVFERIATGSGVVTREDFVGIVSTLGLLVTEGEVRALAADRKYASEERPRRFSSDLEYVNFHRFIQLGDKDVREMLESESEDEGNGGGLLRMGPMDDTTELARKLRQKIRSWAARHPGKLPALFAALDRDGSGELTLQEFRRLLRAFKGVKLAEKDEAVLMSCFDANGTGALKRDDFLDFVYAPPSFSQVGTIGVAVFNDEYVQALAPLQDGVPPRSLEEVSAIIEESVGAPMATLFESFDAWTAERRKKRNESIVSSLSAVIGGALGGAGLLTVHGGPDLDQGQGARHDPGLRGRHRAPLPVECHRGAIARGSSGCTSGSNYLPRHGE